MQSYGQYGFILNVCSKTDITHDNLVC